MAKVINQYTVQDGFKETVYGECAFCGAEVSRSQYGRDEYCEECGAELDWSEVE